MNLELVEQNLQEAARQAREGDALMSCRTVLLTARLLLSQASCAPKRAFYGACAGAGSEMAALFAEIVQRFEPVQETEKLRSQLDKLRMEFEREEKNHQELLEQEALVKDASVRLTELKKRLAQLSELEAALKEFSAAWAEDSRLIGQLPDSVGEEEVDDMIGLAKEHLAELQGQVEKREAELRGILQKLRSLYPAKSANE